MYIGEFQWRPQGSGTAYNNRIFIKSLKASKPSEHPHHDGWGIVSKRSSVISTKSTWDSVGFPVDGRIGSK